MLKGRRDCGALRSDDVEQIQQQDQRQWNTQCPQQHAAHDALLGLGDAAPTTATASQFCNHDLGRAADGADGRRAPVVIGLVLLEVALRYISGSCNNPQYSISAAISSGPMRPLPSRRGGWSRTRRGSERP